MYKRIIILQIVIMLFTVGCSSSESKRPSNKVKKAKVNVSCESLKAGLPDSDPMFNLKGRVTTNRGYTHEIVQLGKIGTYHEYFVDSPCGKIPFYQVSKAQYVSGSRRYKVMLKNGKGFTTNTNIPFSKRDPDKKYYYNVLIGSHRDEEKKSWFWYVTKDPRYKEPREVSLDPTLIIRLDIN